MNRLLTADETTAILKKYMGKTLGAVLAYIINDNLKAQDTKTSKWFIKGIEKYEQTEVLDEEDDAKNYQAYLVPVKIIEALKKGLK